MDCHVEEMSKAFTAFGTTTKVFSETLFQYFRHVPPISEVDIALVMANPSLSWFQKKVLVHKMKKIIRKTDR